MKSWMSACVLTGVMMLSPGIAATALDAPAQREFDRTMNMSMDELTAAAADLLARKYPDEQWGNWHFPDYVFTDQTTATSYKIAVKEPRLLGLANLDDKHQVIPCYCTCQHFGHANLLYCFLKDGRPGGEFDEHGSQCDVCMRQAFLAFLWDSLGASHAEIIQGMEKKFAPLIERYQKGKESFGPAARSPVT